MKVGGGNREGTTEHSSSLVMTVAAVVRKGTRSTVPVYRCCSKPTSVFPTVSVPVISAAAAAAGRTDASPTTTNTNILLFFLSSSTLAAASVARFVVVKSKFKIRFELGFPYQC